MRERIGIRVMVALISVFIGLTLAGRHEILSTLRHPGQRTSMPAALHGAPDGPSSAAVHSWLRVRELRILNRDSTVGMRMGASREGTPEIWMTNSNRTAVIETGVHGDGFPFFLISDGTERSSGLGRVDGPKASPILVFRGDNLVRMVLGLSMTEMGQPPFLVRYAAEGETHDFLGRHCDRPDPVCAH